MVLAQQSSQLTGLARQLVMQNLLSEQDAVNAIDSAKKNKLPFVQYVTTKNLVKSLDIATLASTEFGTPLLDISTVELESSTINVIKENLITKHHALPLFKRGARLFIAVADPTNIAALDEIKFQSGLSTEAILVEADKLEVAIEKALSDVDSSMNMDEFSDDDLKGLDYEDSEQEDEEVAGKSADDAPVVKFVNKILLDAINKGASDVHFEPYEKFFRVRLRIDGLLQEVAKPPVNLTPRILARIKVLSRLDISERRIPQDGRMRLKISKNRAIDFRVSTCPTLFGEKAVLRILDPSSAKLGIDALGYEEFQKQLYLDALSKPQGMILVTGPTGSGKTVSLYTGLNILNTEGVNISTAEDPAEINLPGVNQVNVNPKTGLTFAAALRSFLRQDPDIVMVGEIRDLETAEIGIKAAQTGHMVLSTLHTNDAPQTLGRLMNMGVPPYNIASAVSLIIAQRLARRLCESCKQAVDIPKEALLEEGFTEENIAQGFEVYKPVGCSSCNAGYKGRVGIYQVMKVSDEMGRIIMEGGNAIDLADQAKKEGIPDLRESGLKKVMDGITSLEEINRVTKD
ncbi:MAG: type IV-A pilus assembly ATPase PilB [gamma proteobacterium symbiont of Bathyaustriella thionipta]|nr:type IV-A pilus assembly ATPase PilB [gamma proteobacterium symbiont of Bathyaustriella thionipta]MCU7948709.1 type IV-A pilus assembly ATPase PilB [gamma proteobacterium symbiont of Bathyaustriella thionipta]MCU7953886.1 type IV-A pilus assembly ATPase PilB [gamma proteobacterium symbiont of Bathyaustriella thionipta]MCU7955018.1 type IV-A pilus assembly ATPase PilB [gamma proteobacterium symbiont of Bathyaustriella thionipta]